MVHGTRPARNSTTLGGKELWHTGYQPLHENLGGVAGNGELTDDSCGTMENDGVKGGNREVDEETIHG
jgi:hypothetical protein